MEEIKEFEKLSKSIQTLKSNCEFVFSGTIIDETNFNKIKSPIGFIFITIPLYYLKYHVTCL